MILKTEMTELFLPMVGCFIQQVVQPIAAFITSFRQGAQFLLLPFPSLRTYSFLLSDLIHMVWRVMPRAGIVVLETGTKLRWTWLSTLSTRKSTLSFHPTTLVCKDSETCWRWLADHYLKMEQSTRVLFYKITMAPLVYTSI